MIWQVTAKEGGRQIAEGPCWAIKSHVWSSWWGMPDRSELVLVQSVCSVQCCPTRCVCVFHAELCTLDCGSHGVCSRGICQCEEGWVGPTCEERTCHSHCAEHGHCKDGRCECSPGWEGDHCTIGKDLLCLQKWNASNSSPTFWLKSDWGKHRVRMQTGVSAALDGSGTTAPLVRLWDLQELYISNPNPVLHTLPSFWLKYGLGKQRLRMQTGVSAALDRRGTTALLLRTFCTSRS